MTSQERRELNIWTATKDELREAVQCSTKDIVALLDWGLSVDRRSREDAEAFEARLSRLQAELDEARWNKEAVVQAERARYAQKLATASRIIRERAAERAAA